MKKILYIVVCWWTFRFCFNSGSIRNGWSIWGTATATANFTLN